MVSGIGTLWYSLFGIRTGITILAIFCGIILSILVMEIQCYWYFMVFFFWHYDWKHNFSDLLCIILSTLVMGIQCYGYFVYSKVGNSTGNTIVGIFYGFISSMLVVEIQNVNGILWHFHVGIRTGNIILSDILWFHLVDFSGGNTMLSAFYDIISLALSLETQF